MHTLRSENRAEQLAMRWRQHGAILPLFAIGMLLILVMAGLALDMSHAMLNKSRLQNVVDAAALNAAKVLDESKDTDQARTAALAVFGDNAATDGNTEMAANVDTAGEVIVEFSATLDPFVDGSAPAEYVRVRVEDFEMQAFLIQLLGFDEKNVGASAVSGPTPTVGQACDIAPFIVCGDPAAGGPLWGYNQNDVNVLKGGSDNGSSSGPIGPGNFQLARLGDSTGGSDMRVNAAGGYEGCAITGDNIPTEPGNTVGPVVQGVNTRLGCPGSSCGPFKNQSDIYPPDVITETQSALLEADGDQNITLNGNPVNTDADLDFSYTDYQARLAANDYDNPPTGGAFDRRNLTIPIADCTGINTGATELPILGFGCYFLLQEVIQQGQEAEVYGQFLDACEASGNIGPEPTTEPGPYKIVLYKDPDSTDS